MSAKKILIIEDNISVLASYLQILDALNLDVIPFVAPTYEKAAKIFALEHIDLIIMDLILPDVISTDVLDDIRRMHANAPILLVTGYPEQLDRSKATPHVSRFFTKPFRWEELRQAIHSSLCPGSTCDLQ